MLNFKSDNKKKKITKMYLKILDSDGNYKKVKIKYFYFKSNGVKKYLYLKEHSWLMKSGVVKVSYVTNNSNGTYTEDTGFTATGKYYHPVFNKRIADAISEGYNFINFKINSSAATGADFGSVNQASATNYAWVTKKPTELSAGGNKIKIPLTDYNSNSYPSCCLNNLNEIVQSSTQTLSDVWFSEY